MNLRQAIVIVIGVGIIGAAFWLSGLLAQMKAPPETKIPEEIIKYVATERVAYSEIPTEVVAFGRVRAAESLDLIAEVSGRMSKGNISLKEGQRFKKGNLIYSIDASEASLSLQAKKSTFLKDLAAILPDIKIDFSDNYTAWEAYFNSVTMDKPMPALPEYKSSKEKTFLATRNIFSSFYAIKSDEINLTKYRYYAPFDGVITNVNLQSGSYVNPGANIARVLRSDKLELKVDVKTEDIRWIGLGVPATILSEGNQEWIGQVARIGEFVNQNTQSIDVFLAVNQGTVNMYDGEYLKAKIPGKTVESGMEIPRNLIYNNNQVFILEDSLLQIKEINILKINSETAIFNGLTEGSELVTEPLINAHNNMKAFKKEKGKDINLEVQPVKKVEENS